MHLKNLLLFLIVPFILGCLPVSTRFVPLPALTAEQRAAAARLPVYEEMLPPGTYESLDEVRGLSCQINAKDNYHASRDDAFTELQRATVREGGTAVMGVRCTPLQRGQSGTNCFRAFECRGIAVRLDGGPAE